LGNLGIFEQRAGSALGVGQRVASANGGLLPVQVNEVLLRGTAAASP
jgi:hypothetical protein